MPVAMVRRVTDGAVACGRTGRWARGLACVTVATHLSVAATALAPHALSAQGASDPVAVRLRTLSGRVVDGESGRPLVGAEVLVNDGALGRARTSADGRWHLALTTSDAVRVRVRHPGYAFREFVTSDAARMSAPAEVALRPLAINLDAVVVTAARREQRLAEAVVETSLITSREIAERGASDVAAILTERSGLQLDGGVPAGAGVQMRGFDSRRVLILLDGQPLVGRVGGHFDLSRIPASLVERIEVVKGPQSTLYGSDALGGVVNIITRRPARAGWEAGLTSTAGSQGRRDVSANALGRRGTLAATVDGGVRRQQLAPGVSGESGTFANRWNGHATARWRSSGGWEVEGGALGIGESQRYRTGQLFRFADNAQWGARALLRIPLGAGLVTTSAHLSTFGHLSRASTLDRPASDSGALDRQRLLQGDVLYNGAFGRTLVDAGVQLRHEDISADRLSVASPDVRSVEPFAQATLVAGRLSLTPGARVTLSDRWGNFVAPRLALLWRPVDAVALRAGFGRGYRAPDFKELYLDFVNSSAGYAVRGNPDLRPESSTSTSAGVEWTSGVAWWRGGVFHNDYTDFIEAREPDAAGTYSYDNIARGSTSGLELEAGVQLSAWRLEGSYDHLRSRDGATGSTLLGRPRHTARASATAPLGLGVKGSASLLFTGRTPLDRDATGAVSRERAGWTRVDTRVSRTLPLGIEWSLGVTNLMDRRLLDTWPGYTGRQVFASLAWRTVSTRR